MVMLIMTVLSVVASALLLTTTMRYHTTFQSASWQEAVVGAEAGVDLAMDELRKRVIQGPNAAFLTAASTPAPGPWTATAPGGAAFADYGHAFPGGSQPALVGTHGGEGNAALQTRVYVDVPGSGLAPTYANQNFAIPPPSAGDSFISQSDNPKLRDADGVDRSRWWYRVRALGIAGLSGPPVANLQKMDNRLRRFSFFTDWRTGQAVAAPQTARLVEAIVRPQTGFRNALMADKQINLNSQNVLIDSYDSSKGPYSDPGNVGTMGNLATNGQLINAGNAKVSGDAMTNNGSIIGAGNVTGQQSSSFYQELTPLTTSQMNPSWSGVPSGGTVLVDQTFTASPDPTNPTLVRLNGILLPLGGQTLTLAAPPAAKGASPAPSYLKMYVQGDINTNGSSAIEVAEGVNAIIYFTGNVSLHGDGIINDDMTPSHLVLNGIQPPANPDGSFPVPSITIATDQDFEGVVYAPNHDLDLNMIAAQLSLLGGGGGGGNGGEDDGNDGGKKHKPTKGDTPAQGTDHANHYNGIYGGFVARTINVEAATHVHYDETLRQAGPVNHYEITNWFEDNLSRDATGGTELFWWPVAAK